MLYLNNFVDADTLATFKERLEEDMMGLVGAKIVKVKKYMVGLSC